MQVSSDLPKAAGIYRIVNIVSGKEYIGQAENLQKRYREHTNDLAASRHRNSHLQRSYNHHGSDAFRFEIVELVSDLRDLDVREQHYIDSLDPARRFNICLLARSSRGVKRSEATIAKMRGRIVSAATRAKLRAAQLGRQHSTESRAKMSATHKGRTTWNRGVPTSAEVKEKIAAKNRGQIRPKTTASLMGHRGWNRGMIVSEETRAKLSAAGKGRPKSEEHKRKIGLSNKGTKRPGNIERNKSEEFRRKVSAGRKAWWAAQRARTSPLRFAQLQLFTE